MSLSSIVRLCCILVLMFIARQAFAQNEQDPFGAGDPFSYAAPDAANEAVVKRPAAQTERAEPVLMTRADMLSKLREPISFDFFDEPLSGVRDFLKDIVMINVQLDEAGLALVAVIPDDTFTMALSGVTVEQGLDHLLSQKDCTFIVRDSMVLITSLDAAEKDPVTDFYDMTDLEFDKKNLVSMIEQHISPESWSIGEKTGYAKVTMFTKESGKTCLIITQTEKNHRRCRDFLAGLRKALVEDEK